MLNLVIFGPPGSGKGTQSAHIQKKYGLLHLSTGEMLRKEISSQTDLGKKCRKIRNQRSASSR